MKIQDQICTFEQGQRLKELGVIQGKSTYSQGWAGSDNNNQSSAKRAEYLVHTSDPANSMSPQRTAWGWGLICSRFTAAELGGMLAVIKDPDNEWFDFWIAFESGKWVCRLLIIDEGHKFPSGHDFQSNSMAESLAAALIWCIETHPDVLEVVNKEVGK